MVEQVANNNLVNGKVKGSQETKEATVMDKHDVNKKEKYIEKDAIDFGVFAIEYPDASEQSDGIEVIWPVTSKTETKPIVVVLLGWAGANDKHLAKYSDLYLSRGCIIVRYTAPPKVVMFHLDKLPRLTSKVIEMLKKFELDSHPMFFHLFSNGGGFTYSYMLAELALLREHLDIRGTICDSAPAPRRINSYYRALLNILEPYGGLRYVLAGFMVVLLVLSVFWVHLKNAFRFCMKGDVIGFEPGHPTHNWLGRISQYRKHNFLFIYSDGDDIIRSHLVEQFANFMEKQDNNVKYLKFKDSLHVQHYRAYPKEYVETITTFIREVMNAGENQTQFPTQY